MSNRATFAAWVLVFTLAQSLGQSSSQTRDESRATKPGNPATPDISGVWNVISGTYQYAAFSKDEPPMTPWGKARYQEAKPSQGLNGVKLEETNDRVYKCAPPGMPYIYIQLFPVRIIQTPTEVIELFEYDHTLRYIYTDGRKHPADLQPSYNGHSIGRWQGDTLVVDTVGLNGKNWLDRVGHPESAEMHILERIHRLNENTLQVDLTFDDPKSYTKPWTAQLQFGLRPNWEIMEHVCEDNFAFEAFEK